MRIETNKLDSDYMTLALQLAEDGRYSVSPNPMVGCVIVNNQRIVGTGFHQCAGEAHAEVIALQAAQTLAQGSIVYITIEPCCHTGKTPPCTNALIAAGVKKVVVACLDPNPLVQGKGVAALRAAGIEVTVGLQEAAAKKQNEIFFHYMLQQRPFVIAKWAMSLDGKTITHPDDDKNISGLQAQEATHQLRQQVDAILVGANTALRDNPQLTVRIHNPDIKPKHPLRIILTTHGNLPLDLQVFNASVPGKTLVATTALAKPDWCAALRKNQIEVLVLPLANNRVDLAALLIALGERGITSLLVEGGMTVHHAFMQENLVNKVQVLLAPLIIGDLSQKQNVQTLQWQQTGHDLHLVADVRGTHHV